MTGARRGLLLLCCPLGDPAARPLTMAQYRALGRRVAAAGAAGDPDRPVTAEDLQRLGCAEAEARRIAALLDREEALERYLAEAERRGFFPVTRLDGGYPAPLLQKRGDARPPLFFCAGDPSALTGPYLGLAGARNARPDGLAFAAAVGELAAGAGLTLVTGGAHGADRAAMDACLRAGGRTVTFVPDDLRRRADLAGPRSLVCSEGGYDLAFSVQRAMMRNQYVHMMGEATVAVQPGFRRGGTWHGAAENLRRGWSRLYVYDDGSAGAAALMLQGAAPVSDAGALIGAITDGAPPRRGRAPSNQTMEE